MPNAMISWAGRAVVVGAALVSLAAPSGASATTYTVSGQATADASSPCDPTSHVCGSLRSAINAADADPSPPATVQLGAGTYTLQGVGSSELDLTNDMAITGAGSGSTTIQQADPQPHRVISVATGVTVSISGLTITGGRLTGGAAPAPSPNGTTGVEVFGAGISNLGTLALDHVIVAGNTLTGGVGGDSTGSGKAGGNGGTADGAGIFNQGTLTLTSSAVSDNHAVGGAGGNSTSLTGLTGGNGGPANAGLSNPINAGDLTIQSSTISGNGATGGIGGSTVTNARFGGSGGQATGGISDQSDAAIKIVDSTISNNTATGGAGGAVSTTGTTGGFGGVGDGGGLQAFSATTGILDIGGSTLSGNAATGGAGGSATGSGAAGTGGDASGGGADARVPTTLLNTTVVGNTALAGGVSPHQGQGVGGGIVTTQSPSSLELASVTLAGNTASSRSGNLDASVTVGAQDTIIADGAANSDHTTDNCSLLNPSNMLDSGHNLESTSPSQCGFTAASDLLGVDALLQPLAANGGPTQTTALGFHSPALGAGGPCSDPHSSARLTVDQRGMPRPNPCDIGAFQGQPPVGTGAPLITGTPTVGQTLSCSQGSWIGDMPLTFTYAWLRDGSELPAATPTYLLVAADAAHQVTCRVTASNSSQTSQVSSAVTVRAAASDTGTPTPGGGSPPPAATNPLAVPPTTLPTISMLTIAPKTFVAASSGASVVNARRTGAVVSFTLNAAAIVRFTVAARLAGRTSAGRCVKPTKANLRRHSCTRVMTKPGSVRRTGARGANRFRFTGRLSGIRLTPGAYELVGVPSAGGKTGHAATAFFEVVK